MRKLIVILVLILSSCTPKVTEVWRTRYIEKDILRDSIVYVEIPKEKVVNRVKDTTSILQNNFSESTAYVDSSGFLNHSLTSKDQKIPFKIIYRDRYTFQSDTVEIVKLVKGDTIIKKVVPKWVWFFLGAFIIIIPYSINKLINNIKNSIKWKN